LYGGELIWRERQIKADQLQDAMPVPAWVIYGGKLVAVFLSIAVLLIVTTLGGVIIQAAQGYTHFQLGLYAQVVGLIALPIALAIVALAMGVHAIVNQKFVGHLIIISYWVIIPVLSNLGLDHRLYQIGRPGDFTYSDMARWGPYLTRLYVFEFYSVAFCLMI